MKRIITAISLMVGVASTAHATDWTLTTGPCVLENQEVRILSLAQYYGLSAEQAGDLTEQTLIFINHPHTSGKLVMGTREYPLTAKLLELEQPIRKKGTYELVLADGQATKEAINLIRYHDVMRMELDASGPGEPSTIAEVYYQPTDFEPKLMAFELCMQNEVFEGLRDQPPAHYLEQAFRTRVMLAD